MEEQFNIPVCLFIFRRSDTVIKIIERIAKVKPRKLYLISDQGRNFEEKEQVRLCREAVEDAISWECEVIKDYADENRGVFKNIGLGAMRVFEKEDMAIFLEDDNLPEVTFFEYCREMLLKYRDNDRILWVCGTNYLGKYENPTCESYMFTQQLLPCGWASWKYKYEKYYDKYFENYNDVVLNRMKKEYILKPLFRQQLESIDRERNRYINNLEFRSWDYQMIFTIMSNDLLGISPVNNQIRNIGVDEISEHGGNSYNDIMTKRFCGMDSYPLEFPLQHPKTVQIDYDYEKSISKIILYPLSWRVRKVIKRILLNVLSLFGR